MWRGRLGNEQSIVIFRPGGRIHVRSTATSVARVSGLIALAAAASLAFSAAQAAPPPKKPHPAPRVVTHTQAPRTVTRTPTVNRTVTHNPTVTPNRTFTPNRTVTRNPNVTPQHTGPAGPGTATFHRGPIGGGATPLHTPVAGVGPAGLRLGPHGPAAGPGHLHAGPAGLPGAHPNFPTVRVGNRFFPINKGQRFVWFGGVRRTFVPLALLGTVLIGGAYWYPDAYVSIAGPACGGLTPDGCELHWRDVDFVDGGGVPQCVQYCPWSGPPPAQVATLPPAPPISAAGNLPDDDLRRSEFRRRLGTDDRQPAKSLRERLAERGLLDPGAIRNVGLLWRRRLWRCAHGAWTGVLSDAQCGLGQEDQFVHVRAAWAKRISFEGH